MIIHILCLTSRPYSVSITRRIRHRLVNVCSRGTHSLARIARRIWHFGSSGVVLGILDRRLVVTGRLRLSIVISWIAIYSLEFVKLIHRKIRFHLLFPFLPLLLSLQFLCCLALFHLFLLFDLSLSFLLKSLQLRLLLILFFLLFSILIRLAGAATKMCSFVLELDPSAANIALIRFIAVCL